MSGRLDQMQQKDVKLSQNSHLQPQAKESMVYFAFHSV